MTQSSLPSDAYKPELVKIIVSHHEFVLPPKNRSLVVLTWLLYFANLIELFQTERSDCPVDMNPERSDRIFVGFRNATKSEELARLVKLCYASLCIS